jgi:hypothetical protein
MEKNSTEDSSGQVMTVLKGMMENGAEQARNDGEDGASEYKNGPGLQRYG